MGILFDLVTKRHMLIDRYKKYLLKENKSIKDEHKMTMILRRIEKLIELEKVEGGRQDD